MPILEILTAGQGGQVVGNLARSFGLDREQSAAVLGAVVPELTRAMERNSFNRGGIADLVAALGRADYPKVLAPGMPLDSPEVQASGIDVLDTVLWSKDRSRTLAHVAARQSGVDEALIRQMLPAIAALVMGGLSSKAGGALDGILKQLGTLPQGPLPVPGEAPVRRVEPVPASDATLAPRSGGIDVGQQRPLPVPGERPGLGRQNNPYGDLSDIIRRGGVKLPRSNSPPAPSPDGGGIELPQGGGSLDSIIRDVLGGILGFQNKGVLGWIIRMIVLRWGWGFIQSILRRVLLGR